MLRKEYLSSLIRLLTPAQIKLSAENPSKYMTKTHVLLHYVALRNLGY